MVGKLAAVAIGGNSLIQDPKHPEIKYQWAAVRETCEHIASMIAEGWSVVLTHGNGPQVGYILRRAELAATEVHTVPLDLIVADTQGAIGYMLQQALDNALRGRGINRTIVTVVTQVRVDPADPAFLNPSKPIGGFMTEEQARRFAADGWHVVEDAGRGWRRVVASPKPQLIHEINAIRALILSDYIVIAVGGGGVPVMRDAQGELRGVQAVIDKDLASSLLAQNLRADLFVISTGVEKVSLNFRQPNERQLDQMTLSEARRYIDEGHFAVGSMLPKIEAAVEFVGMGGPQAIITNPPNLARALRGETGTRIVPG
ncbi:MAG: carbamate kinase [Aggregatilineales bacterium]